MRLLNPKRWSLQKRTLIIAACAVGATAVVIAGIFTFALVRLYVTANETAQMRIGSAALHMVEDEIEARQYEIKTAAGQIELLGEAANLQALLADIQFGKNGYVWIGLTDARGVVTASTGGLLQGQMLSAHDQAEPDLSPSIDWLDAGHPLYAVLPERSKTAGADLLRINSRVAGRGQLTAIFRSGISESTIAKIHETLQLDAHCEIALVGRGLERPVFSSSFEQVRIQPKAGTILHALGWEMIFAHPPERRTVPNYAFVLTAIAVCVGVAGAARGIHWASRPALMLADAATQRLEVEALLDCGEVPPDLEPMSRHIVSLHRVSEQRTQKLEDMLREMTSRFNEITANFPGVIYRRTVEADGTFRYIYVSPSCRKYLGVEPDDVLADGNMWFRNFHAEDAARVRNVIRTEQNRPSGAVLTQYRVTGSDGIQRWMQGLAEPHVSVSGELVWEGVAVDISALKAAEARALELRQEEQQLRRKADAENEAKSRFLAVMSHEIRNPLNSIAGYARLVQERAGEQGELRQYAHVIEQASGHLELIVNDVLDFSKIEAGRVNLDQSGFSLGEVASFLKGQMAVLAAGKNVMFDVHNEIASGQVIGDRMRLTQILMNLLTNAFKFTTEGRVVLSMAEVARAERDVTVRFKVTDSGIGMDADALSRIFKPFEQADASSSRRFGGTGLGLAIAQRLAKLMDSEIHVSSKVGEGSAFWFDLRLGIETRGVVRRASGRQAPPIVSGGLKVLIADDNEVNSRLLAAMLGARGYECRTVSSGAAVFDALADSAYGVLLLDIDMPEMDGYEVATRIRQSEDAAVREMRIVAITGNAFAEDVERALESGIDDHMPKPTDFDALFRLLREEEWARGIRLKPGAVA